MEKFSCPRRHEIGQKLSDTPSDTWVNDRCNYCGCFNPDLLMEFLRAERITLGTTDKNYKVYVEFTRTADQSKYGFTKFYFQHLSADQQREFVDLWNNRKITLDADGWYVKPFFMKSVSAE